MGELRLALPSQGAFLGKDEAGRRGGSHLQVGQERFGALPDRRDAQRQLWRPPGRQCHGEQDPADFEVQRLGSDASRGLVLPHQKGSRDQETLDKNRKDKDSKFRLILTESRIHRLARWYKRVKSLPATFKYV